MNEIACDDVEPFGIAAAHGRLTGEVGRKRGCCAFWSYGTVPCPPDQEAQTCGAAARCC